MNMAARHSARIRILSCIPEVLLRQPLPLLVILRNVDPFDLENDRPRAVVTAGDHHAGRDRDRTLDQPDTAPGNR